MNIIITGGGTGGHLFPGIAIAQEFLKRSPDNSIVFIGSKGGIESRILPKYQLRLKTVTIKGFKGKGVIEKIKALFSVPGAFLQAGYYVKRFQADIIVGLGGYISFPALAAGAAMGVPTVIHEQNSIPGLANRILGRMARRVFVSFETSRQFFKPAKTVFTGVPVRQLSLKETAAKRDQRFCIFVCGGSQGAREINQAVMAALPHLTGMQENLRFIHQTGKHEKDLLEQTYKKFGFRAQVFAFIEDIFSCYLQAHLVISRAGAATLAELALCARASILIPYPYAADNHQEKNAAAFLEKGAALMIRSRNLSALKLSAVIMDMAKNREKLRRMETRAKSLSRPNAAETIVNECCQLLAVSGVNVSL